MELVSIKDNKSFTTSRKVAVKFKKDHSKVLRAIQNLECGQEFSQANFGLAEYLDEQGKPRPEYIMTRDGFMFLVMGFTGKQAAAFKVEYINAFNKAEELLKQKAVAPMTTADMFLMQAQYNKEIETKLLQIDNRIEVLEAKQNTSADNYFTIAAYGTLQKIKIDKDTANTAGRKASKVCREMGYMIGKVPDAKYASINTYPADVIETVFKNIGLTR